MCRCNPINKKPYCPYCETLIPKRGIKREILCEIIDNLYTNGCKEEEILLLCKQAGFIITEGEVEVAVMMLKYIEDNL